MRYLFTLILFFSIYSTKVFAEPSVVSRNYGKTIYILSGSKALVVKNTYNVLNSSSRSQGQVRIEEKVGGSYRATLLNGKVRVGWAVSQKISAGGKVISVPKKTRVKQVILLKTLNEYKKIKNPKRKRLSRKAKTKGANKKYGNRKNIKKKLKAKDEVVFVDENNHGDNSLYKKEKPVEYSSLKNYGKKWSVGSEFLLLSKGTLNLDVSYAFGDKLSWSFVVNSLSEDIGASIHVNYLMSGVFVNYYQTAVFENGFVISPFIGHLSMSFASSVFTTISETKTEILFGLAVYYAWFKGSFGAHLGAVFLSSEGSVDINGGTLQADKFSEILPQARISWLF